MYEVFEHTADVGLRVTAPELDGLFEDAARGLFSLIVENPAEVREQRQVQVALVEGDRRYLLHDWLNELLFRFDSERLLLSRFDVRVGESGLEAEAYGEPLDHGRHRLAHEVKAITYHGLMVQRESQGWVAEVILDI